MAPKLLPSPLPLFPLPGAVLFPKMPLPLHVFEERYRQMVRDVVDAHEMIGMILLRPGWEADYDGRPAIYARGCAGRVERCESLPDGRFDLVLRGVQRFRVVEEHGGKPYRLATVEPLVEQLGEASALEARVGRPSRRSVVPRTVRPCSCSSRTCPTMSSSTRSASPWI